MTEQELISVQDSFFDMAKSLLLERGYCAPMGFIVSGAGGEDGISESGNYEVQAVRDTHPGQEPQYSIIAFDMEPQDNVLLKQLCIKYPDILPAAREGIKGGVELFGFTLEEAFKRTLDVLLSHLKIDRKQIVVWMAKDLCDKAKAFAFIHVCEGYGLAMEREENRENYPKSLSEHPDSREILMSFMDAFNFRRSLNVQINRETPEEGKPRDSGKITSLGELLETIDRGNDEGNKLRGRFVEILPQVD